MDSADSLREAILDNLRTRRWRVGQRLPTERELGAQYGLSRSRVRRVLLDLKRLQLITQTVGSGTYVSDHAPLALADLTPAVEARGSSPAELMTARIAIEPAIIDLVVGHATAADFERMDECLRGGEAAVTFGEFERWDSQLHEAVADAAHNRFVTAVFRLINEARAQGEWGQLKLRSATPERREIYQAQHRALVAALKQRDAPRAREVCLAHLLQVRSSLLGY